jgi:ankyrin repeat protein
MLALIKDLQWKEAERALSDSPQLLGFRDGRGRNWLHLCCGVDINKRRLKAADSIRTAEMLLHAGLDINGEAFSEDNFKATPLWYAVAFGRNFKLAGYLLQRGCDPNHCLFAAAYNEDVAMIRLLVKHGALIDPDVEDASPFLFAVQWSRFAAAAELLRHGADVNFQNSKRMTALHYMLKKGTDPQYIRMVVNHGARGDIPNAKGDTAAAIMMRKRSPDLRKLAAQLL